MASVKYNVVTHGVSGKVGDLLIFSQRFGKTIIGKIPLNSGKLSDKQRLAREKFLKAVAYAKSSMADPALRAIYEQNAGEGVTAANRAVADFFSMPVISGITLSNYTGMAGDKIEVQATDDTKVTEVLVRIEAADGSLIEEGSAMQQQDSDKWVYAATAGNPSLSGTKITATAKDLPGNSTAGELVL
jgi:hypothetical protein